MILLSLSMAFGLAACGKNQAPDSTPEAAQTVEFIRKTAMTRIVTVILYLRFISHLLFFIGYFMQTCPHYMSLFLPVPVSRSAVISLIPSLAQRSVFF